ncbi:aspartate-semialdehyde dehydrogenase [Parasphaerochaeta coccoides]|uniref:Aspartate-semialdehyde dehydrogenase n=1 Tax=Parasphaerochaeta coccoides (strain ATCC BAA-1237 / DSM 17374 / SPN1) TaxID=760011 RepID=F4GM52_PARC1|nr:aspartate-semialdehyde dehydrogenase [Parasphaerochaeta coccoides]AEC02527.1 aspartate-semialdehyde dehydrogenase [Parasphaerochaeta coccoides DSM 17374]
MSNKKINVAVLGATGAVGQVFTWMLSRHPWFNLTAVIASERRVGHTYSESVHWLLPFDFPPELHDVRIQAYDPDALKAMDVRFVFSALPAEVASDIEKDLRGRGFNVFSNAASLRYEKNIPILIPEANPEQLDWVPSQGYPTIGSVVTNANCATTGLAVALAPLKKYGIKEISVSSYQSISGAGYPGLSALDISGNVIPYIGGEEEKVEKEIKKILDINPAVYAYCIRVPVIFGHMESVWVEFEQEVDVEDVIRDWNEFKGFPHLPSSPVQPIVYSDEVRFPQSKLAFWGEPRGMVVYTGRVKKQARKIGFVLLVNNIVKGAAGGSIQNAELFAEKFGLRK